MPRLLINCSQQLFHAIHKISPKPSHSGQLSIPSVDSEFMISPSTDIVSDSPIIGVSKVYMSSLAATSSIVTLKDLSSSTSKSASSSTIKQLSDSAVASAILTVKF